jgi:type II restriction/modification system DNA methylase subunit YeeA
MNKEQAKALIIQTFENPFDKENFEKFIKNLLKKFNDKKTFIYQGNYIPDAFKDYIISLERIGQYHIENKEIDLLVVKLQKETSLERARTMQRNFIAWYLKGSRGGKLKDAALVAFVSPSSDDWRFSLVKMEYKFKETSTGRTKVEEEFTPAKRWSFLVGKNEKSHTAQSRFVPILEDDNLKPTLEELEEAFNVEVVTKEFFKEYRDLFIRTKLELDKILKKDERVKEEFENKNINTVDFSKKLLGQIVFLYFLQKKGWFGVEKGKDWGTGPKDFIRRLFNRDFGNYKNFFNDILEPLFYEALRRDRSSDDHYYSRFNCKIPFLNGGLFDPINNYDWVNIDIILPNELFSNSNKTEEGDIGDGILDVFDRYNFTVNEEEPLEKEVALDPELLGKIYEKLNAIRKDNFDDYLKALKSGKKDETKFNKEYGVYYTPREIVHYMCKESLINYLETELNGKVSHVDLERFIQRADIVLETEKTAIEKERKIQDGKIKTTKYESQIPESIKNNAKEIDELLENIKICDPAVGSGAFPIGMMHEIVKLRQLLSIYFGKGIKLYDLKRHAIENSLYGVDIDSGAIETCKLRFWLSLIVDEEDFKNIKPLPNLDYKVVCGNSLLGFPENWGSPIGKEIEELMDKYFSETNPAVKIELKKKIDEKMKLRLEQAEKNFGYKINFDFRLFFQKVFREKNGFDIVIANPPYVRQERIKHLKPQLEKHYRDFYNSMSDLYTYFYRKSYDILQGNGILCFISSNKWMRAKYGENLRKFLKDNTAVLKIIDFSGYRVFEQTVDTNIILFSKGKPANKHTANFVEVRGDIQNVVEYINQNWQTIPQVKFSDNAWTLTDEKVLALKEKIERIGKPLKNWNVGIYYGIKTGYNEAFIIDTETRDRILANCKDEEERKRTEEIIKPVLRGRDIGKYYYKWAGLWLIYIPWHFPLHNDNSISGASLKAEREFQNQYSSLYNYLLQFKGGLSSRNKDETGIRYEWYALQRWASDYYPEFEKEKIVWAETADKIKMSIVPAGLYLSKTCFMLVGEDLKFIAGISNSKLIDWYVRQSIHKLGEKGIYASGYYMEQLPIPPLTPQNHPIANQIVALVDQILSSKKQNPEADTTHLENEIDQLVYQLYGLTEDEIKIVEGIKIN